jgi:hypothetical protein
VPLEGGHHSQNVGGEKKAARDKKEGRKVDEARRRLMQAETALAAEELSN